MRIAALLLCLGLALAAPATVFADASARVLSVTPGVRYSLAGAGEALAVKMDVPVKAVVVSDATGKAQLMFPDDSTLSIAPDTQISLAEYVDAEREENIVLDLVSGTARIITGESNRKNPQAFTVNTPQASIGIRGTLVTIQAGGDVTRVYLSETSGKGVSVRNINTGQVMELRKPGMLINVGVNSMEERKAQKEEAGAMSAALRGKSPAEGVRATAQAPGDMQRATAAGMAPEGTLPPAGGADPVQLAALTVADQIGQGSLVADAAPAPGQTSPPATPTTGSEVAAVPDQPGAPEAPDVPDVPTAPEVPSPSGPGIVVDEGGLDASVIKDFYVIAGAHFMGTGTFDYSVQGNLDLPTVKEGSLELSFPSECDPPERNVFQFSMEKFQVTCNMSFFGSSITDPVKMKLNLNGNFTATSDSMNAEGKLTSPDAGIITGLTAKFTNQDGEHNITLKEPADIVRER